MKESVSIPVVIVSSMLAALWSGAYAFHVLWPDDPLKFWWAMPLAITIIAGAIAIGAIAFGLVFLLCLLIDWLIERMKK